MSAAHAYVRRRLRTLTFNANTVFPSFSMQRVTAPPAPSPRLPSSTIMFSLLAALHPASSRSSTSSDLPFSKVSFSRSGSTPPKLFPLSIAAPPSLAPPAEDAEPADDDGSPEPCGLSMMAKSAADIGPIPMPSPKLSERELPLVSLEPLRGKPAGTWIGGRRGGCARPSCGVLSLPEGVATRSLGGTGRWSGGTSDVPFATGLALGEGGMASPRRGILPALLLREPGIGGRRRGAGDDMAEGVFEGGGSDGVSLDRGNRICRLSPRWPCVGHGCLGSLANAKVSAQVMGRSGFAARIRRALLLTGLTSAERATRVSDGPGTGAV